MKLPTPAGNIHRDKKYVNLKVTSGNKFTTGCMAASISSLLLFLFGINSFLEDDPQFLRFPIKLSL